MERTTLAQRAEALLATRHICQHPDGRGILIQTDKQPDRYYLIAEGRCCCPAFAKVTGKCKHIVAVELLTAWLQPTTIDAFNREFCEVA